MNIQKQKDDVYKLIYNYFSELVLTKVKNVNGNYSVYYANSCNLLCYSSKFIVVVIQNDFREIGQTVRLDDVSWVSFQTRTISNFESSVKLQESSFNTLPDKNIDSKIKLIDKKKDRYVYSCDKYPITQIELLLNEDDTEFSPEGTIKSALETYSCSIQFKI